MLLVAMISHHQHIKALNAQSRLSVVALFHKGKPYSHKHQNKIIVGRLTQNLNRRHLATGLVASFWPLKAIQSNAESSSSTDSDLTEPSNSYSIDELKQIIYDDYQHKQYMTTGNLTKAAFSDDFQFIDPTLNMTGLSKFCEAVKGVSEKNDTHFDIITIDIESPSMITLKWRLDGKVQNGLLNLKAYTGTSKFFINSSGIVYKQEDEWDVSPIEVFVGCFLPFIGYKAAPPIDELRKTYQS